VRQLDIEVVNVIDARCNHEDRDVFIPTVSIHANTFWRFINFAIVMASLITLKSINIISL